MLLRASAWRAICGCLVCDFSLSVKKFATIKTMYFFTPRRCESTQKIMYTNKGQALIAADKSLRERGAQLWVYKLSLIHI